MSVHVRRCRCSRCIAPCPTWNVICISHRIVLAGIASSFAVGVPLQSCEQPRTRRTKPLRSAFWRHAAPERPECDEQSAAVDVNGAVVRPVAIGEISGANAN
jgi:hypothetical protein